MAPFVPRFSQLAHPFFRKKELELHSPFNVSSEDFEGSPIVHEMFTQEDIKGTDFQALVTFFGSIIGCTGFCIEKLVWFEGCNKRDWVSSLLKHLI